MDGSTSTYRIVLRVRSDTTTNITTISNTGGSANIPAYTNAKYLLGEIWVYSGQTVDLTFYPQVEYVPDSTYPATEYSPYVANPIKLGGIGDYKNSIKKSRGKNLIKLTDGTYSSNGVTVVVENGKITLNRTSTSSGTSFVNIPLAEDIVISPNENYTFSANNNFVLGNTTQSGNYACIRFRTSTTDDSTNDVLFGTLDNSKTFQKDTTWTYKYLRVRTASSLSYTNNVIYPQLELRRNKNTLRASWYRVVYKKNNKSL